MLKTARKFTRLGEGACGNGCPGQAPPSTGPSGVDATTSETGGITADVIESALNGFPGFEGDFEGIDLSMLGDLSGSAGLDAGPVATDGSGSNGSSGTNGEMTGLPLGMANPPGRGIHMTGLGNIDLSEFVGSF